MFLFLQGPPRTGKSTLIRDALMPRHRAVAGLMVQRLFAGEQMRGFRACAVGGDALPALEAPYTRNASGIFIDQGKADPARLDEAILLAGAFCERDACRLIILDEIGGLELSSPGFTQALDHILSLGKPCIGVVKSPENLSRTAGRLKLSRDLAAQSAALHRRLAAKGSILDVNGENLADAALAVNAFVSRVLAASPPDV